MDADENKGSTAMYSGKWWIGQITSQEKELDEKFWTRGKRVLDRYTDERSEGNEGESRYNMFWANTEILKSALYAVPPKPSVTRENADAKDDAARVAALMLERILQQGMTKSKSDAHEAIKAAVEDRLLPGMGQVWCRYEAEIEQFTTPAPLDAFGSPIGEDVTGERIVKERVCTDYVNWRDFIWSAARRWNEVNWVARRVWMTKRAFKKRFGKLDGWEDMWKSMKEGGDEYKNSEMLPKGFRKGKAEVFELWCEDTAKVYFVNKNLDDCIDEIDDPLQLEEFFPCPKPLLATHTNESMIPVADYIMVQDQYAELDTLNNRIAMLTKALRVVGAYDSSNKELAKMITGKEMDMIPVENWASLSENGGVAKAVEWFPVEVVAGVLDKLTQQRASVIGQIYELTSISDIMRGASNPRETAKAQQLKAQYSSVRLQLTQQAVATFVQDVLRIKAEIICRHFEPQSIIEQSQIEQTESAEFVPQALEILKNFEAAEYRIEVSEESLSMADYTAEREMRIELVTAIGQFLSQSAQLVQGQPQALPYMLRIVQWVVASFRGSKDVESVLDQAVEAAKNAPPPGEDDGKAQAEQAKAQQAAQQAQMQAQMTQQKAAMDQQMAQAKLAGEQQLEQMRLRMEEQMAAMQGQLDMRIAEMKNQTAVQIAEMNNETKLDIAEINAKAVKASKAETED